MSSSQRSTQMPLRRPARHVYRQLMIRRCCRPREIRSDAKTIALDADDES